MTHIVFVGHAVWDHIFMVPRLTAADPKAAGCHKLGILATDDTLLAERYQIACRDICLEWAAPGEQAQ